MESGHHESLASSTARSVESEQSVRITDLPFDILVKIFMALHKLQDKCAWASVCCRSLAVSRDPKGWCTVDLGDLNQQAGQMLRTCLPLLLLLAVCRPFSTSLVGTSDRFCTPCPCVYFRLNTASDCSQPLSALQGEGSVSSLWSKPSRDIQERS